MVRCAAFLWHNAPQNEGAGPVAWRHDGSERALAAGEAGYLDPVTGLFVFTAQSLSERPCCDNGCRHCPYV